MNRLNDAAVHEASAQPGRDRAGEPSDLARIEAVALGDVACRHGPRHSLDRGRTAARSYFLDHSGQYYSTEGADVSRVGSPRLEFRLGDSSTTSCRRRDGGMRAGKSPSSARSANRVLRSRPGWTPPGRVPADIPTPYPRPMGTQVAGRGRTRLTEATSPANPCCMPGSWAGLVVMGMDQLRGTPDVRGGGPGRRGELA